MNASSPSEFSQLSTGLEAIEIPVNLAKMLKAEARRRRKSVAAVIAGWLEDQADAREASRIMRRIAAGRERVIPAEEVYARLGI